MRLVFLGPPGAGKGTQATQLAQRLGVPHISTGDILRRAIALSTPTGVEAKQFVDRGELVPFEIMLRLVQDRLREKDAAAGWILDGFPRNLAQAQAFAELLEGLESGVDCVVYFDVAAAVVVARLSARRTCRACGAVYHLEYSAPKTAGVCDQCGGSDLYQRTDDREEAIRKRLEVYASETEPLVGHYRKAGVLRQVDAGRAPAEVSAAVSAAIARAE
ncbi:MAG: adenylate kinase [Planctomycetota bacterium]